MEDLRNHEGSEFFTRSSAIVTSSSTRPTKLPLRQAMYFDIIDKYPKVPKARPSTSGNRQELRPLRKGRLELNYIPRQPSAGHQEGNNNNIRPGFSFENLTSPPRNYEDYISSTSAKATWSTTSILKTLKIDERCATNPESRALAPEGPLPCRRA